MARFCPAPQPILLDRLTKGIVIAQRVGVDQLRRPLCAPFFQGQFGKALPLRKGLSLPLAEPGKVIVSKGDLQPPGIPAHGLRFSSKIAAQSGGIPVEKQYA